MTLNFMAAVTLHSEFGAQENKISHCFPNGNPLLTRVPGQSGGWDSVLSLPRTQVLALVGELRSTSHATQQKKERKKKYPLADMCFHSCCFPLPCNFRCAVPWHFGAKTDFWAFPAWPLWIYIRPPNPHFICIQVPTWPRAGPPPDLDAISRKVYLPAAELIRLPRVGLLLTFWWYFPVTNQLSLLSLSSCSAGGFKAGRISLSERLWIPSLH